MTFAFGAAEETLCFVPIHGTGWQVAVLIRESVIQDQIWDISEKNLVATRNQVIFTLVCVLLLASILLVQLRKIYKDKLDEEKETSRAYHNMANTDSLTGVRNKHAYSENETAINQQIRAGALDNKDMCKSSDI